VTEQQVVEPVLADPHVHELVVRRLEAVVAGTPDGAGANEVRPDGLAWRLEAVGYDANSPTTGGLHRVRVDSDPPRSYFVKLLQSYQHWPLLDLVPPGFRDLALRTDLWRYEADVYSSRLGALLPDGLRLPRLYGVDTLDDDHVLLVLEDVRTAGQEWDLQRFGQAAERLSRLAARLTRQDALPSTAQRVPGLLTRTFYEGFVAPAAVPALLAEDVWASPLLRGNADLRHDLAELARRAPAVVDALGRRPQLMGHGDACPQNLLIPADRPDELVAIDWSPSGLVAAGDDLGQLLIGNAHAGTLTVELLPELRELVVARYTAGLAAEGRSGIGEADVRFGLDGALTLRNAFLSIPLHRLGESITEELADVFDQRVRLTRYLVGLGLALPTDH
jgi:hypothetical protein